MTGDPLTFCSFICNLNPSSKPAFLIPHVDGKACKNSIIIRKDDDRYRLWGHWWWIFFLSIWQQRALKHLKPYLKYEQCNFPEIISTLLLPSLDSNLLVCVDWVHTWVRPWRHQGSLLQRRWSVGFVASPCTDDFWSFCSDSRTCGLEILITSAALACFQVREHFSQGSQRL